MEVKKCRTDLQWLIYEAVSLNKYLPHVVEIYSLSASPGSLMS